MDLSSSSSTQQYNQDQYSQDRLEIQERDWLSCSTSTRATATTTTTTTQDIGIEDDNHDKVVVVVEREHMFDKVVTPSDVGKLNRLVIPKQHAEKYFPLDTTNNNNSSCGNNENKAGLLLNFEDRTGKSWRFRYSYWNSSQSYVMTKGWSRFVKEKQLSAGDIVSFQRAVGDDNHSKNTFFIDWRRRPPDHHHRHHLGTAFSVHHSIPTWRSGGSSSSSTTPTFFLRSHPHEPHPHHNSLWDHSNIINNNNGHNNINSHLSPINGNIMSMVPYNHSGPLSGSGSGSESGSRSFILLRSPVPNSGLINHHPYLMPDNPHHISSSPWTSNNDTFQGSFRRDEPPKVYDSVPVVRGIAPSPSGGGAGSGGVGKRSLRLFGVNMEYDQLNSDSNSMGISTTLSMLSNPSTSNLDDPQNSSPSNHSFRHG